MMIELIVTDVDGVIVGQTMGVNFPLPSPNVIEALKKVSTEGTPVVLCTGKYYKAIEPIIHQADLKNPHITDSGSLIINPLAGEIVHAFNIEKNLLTELINTCLNHKIYTESYSTENYFIQKDEIDDHITPHRTSILQREGVIVESLSDEAQKQDIMKLLIISKDEEDKKRIQQLLSGFNDKVTFTWSKHPTSAPMEYCLTTSLNASKAQSVTKLAHDLGISFSEILGVGDTLGDWGFMQLCGYVATMEDAENTLKDEVKSKVDKYFIAPSVEKDGMIDILNHFLPAATL